MSSQKKWILLLTVLILVFKLPVTAVKASENTVYDQFHKNKQQESNLSPKQSEGTPATAGSYALKFIGSFLLVIVLLYVVLRWISRKTKALGGGGVFHAIGGHPIGNHRSVQILMIGDTCYILGVGESVQLIRMIPPGEEQTKLLESVAQVPIDLSGKWKGKWNIFKRHTKQEKWNADLMEQLHAVQSSQLPQKDDNEGRRST